MRRYRKIRMDLLSGDAAAVFLLGIMFLMGGAAGCLAAAGVRGEAGLALQEYLTGYFALTGEGRIDISFGSVLWEQISFPLFVLLFGFTAAGIIGIPVLLAARGFLFTFSVACFCRLFGWNGLLPALVLFGIPAIVWAPVLFVIGSQGICAAYQMFSHLRGKGDALLFCKGNYWMRCGMCGCALVLCAAFEYLAAPVLVRAIAGFVL